MHERDQRNISVTACEEVTEMHESVLLKYWKSTDQCTSNIASTQYYN